MIYRVRFRVNCSDLFIAMTVGSELIVIRYLLTVLVEYLVMSLKWPHDRPRGPKLTVIVEDLGSELNYFDFSL